MKLRYILLTLLALCILAAPAAAAGGAGTATNPYIIQTPAELQSVQNDLSAYYVLGNNIDMSSYNFVPIGSSAAPFFGSLDGRGYTISNLEINLPDTDYVGLFSYVSAGATIKNVNFKDCSVTGGAHTGILYGRGVGVTSMTLTIQNIDFESCVVSGGGPVGTLCGDAIYTRSPATISDCDVNKCTVISSGGSNGILMGTGAQSGGNSICTVMDCTVTNSYLSATGGSNGGIVGYAALLYNCSAHLINNTVLDCIFISQANAAGGIVGTMANTANCDITGCVSGNNVIKCGTTSSHQGAGGIAGNSGLGDGIRQITTCQTFNCTIDATARAGGILGNSGNIQTIISDCSVDDSTIRANSYAAGICPVFPTGT